MEKHPARMKLTAVEVDCSGQPGLKATALLHNVQALLLRKWDAANHGALTGVQHLTAALPCCSKKRKKLGLVSPEPAAAH